MLFIGYIQKYSQVFHIDLRFFNLCELQEFQSSVFFYKSGDGDQNFNETILDILNFMFSITTQVVSGIKKLQIF